MELESWAGSIDLTTPAGQLIQQLIARAAAGALI